MDRHRDHSHFLGLTRDDIVAVLAFHETNGTLAKYLRKVAPDYVRGEGDVLSFTLAKDLKLR